MSTTGTTTQPITNDEGLTNVYQSYREGAQTYAIPLAAGTYLLKLRFMDPTGAGPTVTVPGAPTAVTATAGNGQAAVTWTPPASTGGATVTGYTVTASTGQTAVVAGTATTATVTGLTNGTSVTFTVTATNSAGTGPASTASTPVTPNSANLLSTAQATAEAAASWTMGTGMTSVAQSTAKARSGSHSWAATTAGGVLNAAFATNPHIGGIIPGTTYNVAIWGSSNTSASRHHSVFIQWYDGSGAVTGAQVFSSEVAAAATGWSQVTVAGQAPAGAASMDILPFFGTDDGSNLPAGEQFFYDDLSVMAS